MDHRRLCMPSRMRVEQIADRDIRAFIGVRAAKNRTWLLVPPATTWLGRRSR